MPKIKRVKLAKDTTVGAALHESVFDFLPDDMAEDSLVRWVIDFDSLTKADNDYNYFIDNRREDDWFSFINGVSEFFRPVFESKISFYFASIFHIGRMRKSSELVDSNLIYIKNNDCIDFWAAKASGYSKKTISTQNVKDKIHNLAEKSKKYYSENYSKSVRWFEVWRREVNAIFLSYKHFKSFIRSDIYKCRIYELPSNYRINLSQKIFDFLRQINEKSVLKFEMKQDGIFFNDSPSEFWPHQYENNNAVFIMILVSMLKSDLSSDWMRYSLAEFFKEYILFEKQKTQTNELIATIEKIQPLIKSLETEYREKNPFHKFLVAKGAATYELREIIAQNFFLGKIKSPWLEQWELCLEHVNFSRKNQLSKAALEIGGVVSSFRQADSVIKSNITNEFYPGESWQEFVQRIFSNKWLKKIILLAIKTNKTSTVTENNWTTDDLLDFVSKVVAMLNEHGYSIYSPSSSDIQSLMEEANKS